MLRNWKGAVEIDGTQYDSIQAAVDAGIAFKDSWSIKLLPLIEKANTECGRAEKCEDGREIRIRVKPYMTRKAVPEFDFMAKFNNDNPMPLRVMQGYVEKETRGMQYMKLHGVGLAEVRCLRCGRELTNPVSRHYGIGPECIAKLGFICDMDAEDEIREKLQEIEWEGWVIKSAILRQEEM